MSKSKTSFESVDYEELDEPSDPGQEDTKRPDDFMSIIVDRMYKFDWVFLFIIALIFIIVISDAYGENVLRRFDGAIGKDDEVTTKGHMIQLGGLLAGSVVGRVLFAMAGL